MKTWPSFGSLNSQARNILQEMGASLIFLIPMGVMFYLIAQSLARPIMTWKCTPTGPTTSVTLAVTQSSTLVCGCQPKPTSNDLNPERLHALSSVCFEIQNQVN